MLFLSLNSPLPTKLKSTFAHVLCSTFASAFDVEPPLLLNKKPDEALYEFREFSAACMEAALESPQYAANRRAALEKSAADLGAAVHTVLKPHDEELMNLIAYLYAAIGIGVTGTVPGELTFHRCYFSKRYTPELCAFMSAFDSGFVSGLCGGGTLTFDTRITEGAPCCHAIMNGQGTEDCSRPRKRI